MANFFKSFSIFPSVRADDEEIVDPQAVLRVSSLCILNQRFAQTLHIHSNRFAFRGYVMQMTNLVIDNFPLEYIVYLLIISIAGEMLQSRHFCGPLRQIPGMQ